jgi:hypothetical protein
MFGGNFPDNDAFTNALITNTRVLEVLKKSTNNRPLFTKEESAAWVADAPQKGEKFLAVFNKADQKMAVEEKAVWKVDLFQEIRQIKVNRWIFL